MKDIALRPPPGVAFNQWKDGSIHLLVNDRDVAALKEGLLKAVDELNVYAIRLLETQKAVELNKFVPPPSKIQILEAELARLKEEEKAPKVIVREGFIPGDEDDLGPPPLSL